METNKTIVVRPIEKEMLIGIHFSKEDVLIDPIKIRLRNIYLAKAEKLGNAYKGKVKITFVSDSGEYFLVETTVWAANEEFVSLKGGITILTKSIIEIEF